MQKNEKEWMKPTAHANERESCFIEPVHSNLTNFINGTVDEKQIITSKTDWLLGQVKKLYHKLIDCVYSVKLGLSSTS